MSVSAALVVIDMQRAMFETPGEIPHNGDGTLHAVLALLEAARNGGAPVLFIQHTSPVSGHLFHRDAPGWPLHPALAPAPGERVVEKASFDAFHQTRLTQELDILAPRHLVLCGMQTEFCVDTTCRRAFSLGHDVLLASDAHTTFDTEILPARQIIAHHNRTWNGRFCATLPTFEIMPILGG